MDGTGGVDGTDGAAGGDGGPGLPGPEGPAGADPARVVWVAAEGGDVTSVQAALTSITDAGPAGPYLIRVAPGRYPPSTTLVMKDHGDLEGSGEGVTTLDGTCENVPALSADAVTGEVRGLTVRAVGLSPTAIATSSIVAARSRCCTSPPRPPGPIPCGTSGACPTRTPRCG